jgi:pantoate--beta-alanine ligase
MVKTIQRPDEMRRASEAARAAGKKVGFVPTMGALHEGHMSLVRRCRSECGFSVASIFVNPAQFGPGEDYERYPRDPASDSQRLQQEGVNALFAPEPGTMYSRSHATWVDVEGLSRGLCGPHRPGHFRGVATIVAKLFNIVRPDAAYFGQKDAQQAAIIRRMAADLDAGIEIVVCPTVREEDGLAMSSRNAYLSPEERRQAPALNRALATAARRLSAEPVRMDDLRAQMEKDLRESGFRVQYVEIVDAETLQPLEGTEATEALIAVAAYLGRTRLIDNVTVRLREGRTSKERH